MPLAPYGLIIYLLLLAFDLSILPSIYYLPALLPPYLFGRSDTARQVSTIRFQP